MAEEGAVATEGVEAGADAAANGNGLYDLNDVPEDVREHVVPHLKAMEGSITKKFQEAADYRKGWEPYEELGLRDMEPEQIKQLIDFASMANDPTQFDNWLKRAAEERGLLNGAGEEDLDLEDVEGLSPEKIEELVTQHTQPIKEALENQTKEQAIAAAEEEVQTSLQSIRKDNPNLPENAEDAIEQLAYRYTEDSKLSAGDIIAKGFEDYQSLIGQGEKGLFEKKNAQPETPEGPGQANMGDEKITSFDDPRFEARVKEKIRRSATT